MEKLSLEPHTPAESSAASKLAEIFDPKRMIANMKRRTNEEVLHSVLLAKHRDKQRQQEAEVTIDDLNFRFNC